ncbi:MAG: nodulation protein NfeD [Proteobacteria bacterium]|nr:nodulation protein NfeD [Pseudomonadota bacterium]MDA0928743.1 nodulation protein NfeD [Pseudomonadota bacterium]
MLRTDRTRLSRSRIVLGAVVLCLLGVVSPILTAAEVHLVPLTGAVGPASSDFVIRSLEDAADAGADLVVIQLDTPGGLDAAMRDIIQQILGSPVPVAVWVAPNGARAASAGTYILYASHFAAMAPATNVGSSTPVSIGANPLPLPTSPAPEEETPEDESIPIGDTMERKVINDAVAYIKSLAELRGRNQEWAELTVLEAANLTASEALEMNVIEIIAENLDSLLEQLSGRSTVIDGQQVTLELDTYNVTNVEPDWRHEFLSLITDPNVAYILLMIGIYGLILEFYNPGLGLPGITGVICLLLGAYALQMLPINYVGLALIVVGIGLMVVEAMSPSFGVFGLGGMVAFVLGSVILMDTELEAFRISLSIIAAFAVASTAVFVFALSMLLRARRQKVVSGVEAMVGGKAIALQAFDHAGHVRAFSENWKAESDEPIAKGDTVEIIGIDGLTLKVKKQE